MRIEKGTFLIVLQGLAIALQMLNAQMGILTDNKAVALVISAVIGGFQYVIQHLGNQTVPAGAQKELDKCLPKDSEGSLQQPQQ